MGLSKIGNSELITQVNRRLVLQAVRSLQPTYRAEVSRRTNLNPATVTGIVNDLLELRLLKEVSGETKSPGPAGGRPPMLLELNSDARTILAIDLEPSILRVALVGLNLNIVEYREKVINRRSQPETVIRQIIQLVEEIIGRGKQRPIDGIGLSLPGMIDRDQGILISSTNLPLWRNIPIRDLLAEKLGQAPKVERSVHLAALHEDWTDNSEETNTKLVLALRTGIGMSLITRGELYLGAGGFDGEIGHTVIDLNGPQCECGNRGCLETFVSEDAINQRVRAAIDEGKCRAVSELLADGETLRPELIYGFARDGDVDCADIVRDVGRYVGLAAANLVNLLAPDKLILCGSIDTADELILQAIEEQVQQRSLPQLRRHLKIQISRGLDKSSLLGAAVLVAREMFELPRLQHPYSLDQQQAAGV
ncbi:ROK family protein [Pirellulales bacterium]|nr:ROK family protein [Pirellulales bacterium]